VLTLTTTGCRATASRAETRPWGPPRPGRGHRTGLAEGSGPEGRTATMFRGKPRFSGRAGIRMPPELRTGRPPAQTAQTKEGRGGPGVRTRTEARVPDRPPDLGLWARRPTRPTGPRPGRTRCHRFMSGQGPDETTICAMTAGPGQAGRTHEVTVSQRGPSDGRGGAGRSAEFNRRVWGTGEGAALWTDAPSGILRPGSVEEFSGVIRICLWLCRLSGQPFDSGPRPGETAVPIPGHGPFVPGPPGRRRKSHETRAIPLSSAKHESWFIGAGRDRSGGAGLALWPDRVFRGAQSSSIFVGLAGPWFVRRAAAYYLYGGRGPKKVRLQRRDRR